jgi:hypothetical protein
MRRSWLPLRGSGEEGDHQRAAKSFQVARAVREDIGRRLARPLTVSRIGHHHGGAAAFSRMANARSKSGSAFVWMPVAYQMGGEPDDGPASGRLSDVIVSEAHLVLGEAGVHPCEVAVFGAKARELDFLPDRRSS